MNATAELNRLNAEYAKHLDNVRAECSTMQAASRLIMKWNEPTAQDAIYREAKSRAIRADYK